MLADNGLRRQPSNIGFGDWFGGASGVKQNDALLGSGKWDIDNS